jgi:hypothetical protein
MRLSTQASLVLPIESRGRVTLSEGQSLLEAAPAIGVSLRGTCLGLDVGPPVAAAGRVAARDGRGGSIAGQLPLRWSQAQRPPGRVKGSDL